MPNATSPNAEEFRRALDQLMQQAQTTAQLGLTVAREQVETFVKNPNMSEQLDEVRRNLQTMAHDIETKAQELVHLASTYVPAGAPNPFNVPRATGGTTEVKVEAPAEGESHTAAGAGTAQETGSTEGSTPTPNGEAPKQ